jgi:excisionase family DNA binding protein
MCIFGAMAMQEKLLTTKEVAEILRCGIPSVRLYIKKGKFKRLVFIGKQFLIYESSVEEFLKNHDPMDPKIRID